jgi:ribosomal protein S18 acetylase RimI-like enzyme
LTNEMLTIDAFRPADLAVVIRHLEAIQEHERIDVPDLKPGREIGADYARMLVRAVAERDGCMLLARMEAEAVGFACAWVREDDDPLLRDEARGHAYVSDIFVVAAWRRRGVALRLLDALETEMRSRGCRRIRICSKAANHLASECYKKAGYQPYEIIFAKRLDT